MIMMGEAVLEGGGVKLQYAHAACEVALSIAH
jgi:hypothetical protein